MGSLPRAILLDLDDTILDDSGGVIACWRDACLAHRSSMNGLDADTVFEAIDRTREWYWSDPERHRVGRLGTGVGREARWSVWRLPSSGVDDEGLARQIGDTYHALRERCD
jgi:putative hydrolase of the HAD superfamily